MYWFDGAFAVATFVVFYVALALVFSPHKSCASDPELVPEPVVDMIASILLHASLLL